MKNAVDLRSDTITQPTQEMREAMANARVGDDVYKEDPTVNELEETAASFLGKESALFVPSGTMGNQVALLAHTRRGDEVILDSEAHISYYEVGAPAMFAGVQLQLVPGFLLGDTAEKIQETNRERDIHFPTSRLICLENTFNRGGGTVMFPQKMEEIYQTAKKLNLSLHLDGARLSNAAVAAKCDVKEFTKSCDSVLYCLSKGLSAPVGSILAGSEAFIHSARKYRKALGGGMRQAGILAAAGLVALKMIDRLEEDHSNARILAQGLTELPGLRVNLEMVQTNIVMLDIAELAISTSAFLSQLLSHGIKASQMGSQKIRFVIHKDVSRENMLFTIETVKSIANKFL